MLAASLFGFGVLAGYVTAHILLRISSAGTLRVDRSDPEEAPYLFLELSKEIRDVVSKGYVVLKVNQQNFIPPK